MGAYIKEGIGSLVGYFSVVEQKGSFVELLASPLRPPFRGWRSRAGPAPAAASGQL